MANIKITKSELKKLIKEEVIKEFGGAPGKVVVKIEGDPKDSGILLRATRDQVNKALRGIAGDVSLEVNGIKQTPYGIQNRRPAGDLPMNEEK